MNLKGSSVKARPLVYQQDIPDLATLGISKQGGSTMKAFDIVSVRSVSQCLGLNGISSDHKAVILRLAEGRKFRGIAPKASKIHLVLDGLDQADRQ